LWKGVPFDKALGVLIEKNATRGKIEQWLSGMETVPGFTSFLYENTLIGTLSADDRYVYAVNDLAVPPHPNSFTQPPLKQMQIGDIKPMVIQNELCAYDLLTGKLKWDLNQYDPLFKDSHFLSAPISIGGRLYVLNERLTNPNKGVDKPGFNPIGGG